LGPLGIPETIFIFVLALLVFGPKKLPELGRTLGKAMTEFRRASSELKATFDREMHAIERDSELKEVTQAYNGDTYNYDSYYDSGAYGSESYDYSAQDYSTEGASATQGADAGTTDTANTSGESGTDAEATVTASGDHTDAPPEGDRPSQTPPPPEAVKS
jgi:TatA/E family protein of Tat protein translocase